MKGTIMSEIKLNYHKTHFLTSAPNIRSIPEDTGIEIAFAGRSNAGKSTALNALTNQKSLARTSKTPVVHSSSIFLRWSRIVNWWTYLVMAMLPFLRNEN